MIRHAVRQKYSLSIAAGHVRKSAQVSPRLLSLPICLLAFMESFFEAIASFDITRDQICLVLNTSCVVYIRGSWTGISSLSLLPSGRFLVNSDSYVTTWSSLLATRPSGRVYHRLVYCQDLVGSLQVTRTGSQFQLL